MTQCSYLISCRLPAVLVPVIALPTLRTVSMDAPVLDRSVDNHELMRQAGLNSRESLMLHDEMCNYYRLHQNDMVQTDKPTYLIGSPLCRTHADSYKLTDWLHPSDWSALQEAARDRGMFIPNREVITIRFMPVGWEPTAGYMEVAR